MCWIYFFVFRIDWILNERYCVVFKHNICKGIISEVRNWDVPCLRNYFPKGIIFKACFASRNEWRDLNMKRQIIWLLLRNLNVFTRFRQWRCWRLIRIYRKKKIIITHCITCIAPSNIHIQNCFQFDESNRNILFSQQSHRTCNIRFDVG